MLCVNVKCTVSKHLWYKIFMAPAANPRKLLSDQSHMAKEILPPNQKVQFCRSILVIKPDLNLQNLQSIKWSEVWVREISKVYIALWARARVFSPKILLHLQGHCQKTFSVFYNWWEEHFFAVQTMTGHFQPNKVHNGNLDVISNGFLKMSLRYEVIVIPNPKHTK